MFSIYIVSDGFLKNRLDFNCLTDLPGSIAKLERLEELVLTNNFFAAFPEYVMKLSSLKKVLEGRFLIFGRGSVWVA